jgi:TolB protein
MKFIWQTLPLISCLGFLAITAQQAARSAESEGPVQVYSTAKARVIPISLSGYTGEAAAVLRFDLEVAGFEITEPDKAQYQLTGKNDATQVEGRLQDRLNKATLLAKAFTGETTRSQAHSLSDEVSSLILRIPGVARTKIAFKQEPGRGAGEIFISDYDGHNAKPVTQDKSVVSAPAWMPKHWHLFYTSYKSGYPWIYSHNLSSGERRPFAKFPGLNTGAAVSPDGKRVAMILSKAGSPDLWVCNADGTGLTQLTKTPEDESSPCWSPDGSQICFASRVNERRALYVISASGGKMSRVRTDGVSNPSEPDWSPDGKTIIFTSQMGGFNICTIPAEGGVADILVAGEDPSWAPNSRTVVFTRRTGNKRVLSLLDVPTKRVKDTAQISGSRSQPSWAK